jgi:hypothetical protein
MSWRSTTSPGRQAIDERHGRVAIDEASIGGQASLEVIDRAAHARIGCLDEPTGSIRRLVSGSVEP